MQEYENQTHEHNKGTIVVVELLMIVLALMIAIAIRVFMQSLKKENSDNAMQNNQDSTVVKDLTDKLDTLKNDLKDSIKKNPETIPLGVENGMYIRQSTRNGNWLVTIRYPELPLADTSPAFEFGYPSGAPWGAMRVEYEDATATDAGISGKTSSTPYIAFYTFRSSTNYSQADEGYGFRIVVAPKEAYEREIKIANNIYALNKNIYLTEDDSFVYLYGYLNQDKEVKSAVELLLSTFVALNLETK